MNFRPSLIHCALVLLPLCSAFCRQTSTAPQQSTSPGGWSKSGYVVSFGAAQSNADGKAAVEKLQQALGGAERVNSVKSLRETVSAVQQGVHVEVEETIVYPDKQAQRMNVAGGKTLLVTTPHEAFMVVGTQVQDMPAALRASLEGDLKHDPINVLQHINDPKYIFTATGKETVDGVNATVVDVDADGAPTRWWIGPDGKLLRERAAGQEGKLQTIVYSAWKNFAGLQYPTKNEVFSEGGMPVLSMTFTALEVNPPVSPKVFQRPANN